MGWDPPKTTFPAVAQRTEAPIRFWKLQTASLTFLIHGQEPNNQLFHFSYTWAKNVFPPPKRAPTLEFAFVREISHSLQLSRIPASELCLDCGFGTRRVDVVGPDPSDRKVEP